jgi:hypothetical protein
VASPIAKFGLSSPVRDENLSINPSSRYRASRVIPLLAVMLSIGGKDI